MKEPLTKSLQSSFQVFSHLSIQIVTVRWPLQNLRDLAQHQNTCMLILSGGTIYTFDWVEAFSIPLIKQFYDFSDVIIN